MKKNQGGFTLVEIAIVLAIVGLLLGAALKGQELLFNSKVKATYNLAREMSAAVNTYQDRYKAVPGDDTQAATRFPTAAPAAVNGNGNGVITYAGTCAAASGAENCQALYHMRLAGMINGTSSLALQTPFGGRAMLGNWSAFYPNTGNQLAMALEAASISHKIMSALDTAFDDGNPTTGGIRCRGVATYNLGTPEAPMPDFCSISL